MRRRILTLFVLALIPMLAAARSITRDEAFAYAQKFFGGADRSSLTLVWTGDSQASPSFYAFNRAGGGFLILSGEEAVDPVLGYSREGSFTMHGMPSNVRAWFGSLENDIAEVRRFGKAADAAALRRWNDIGSMTRAGGEVVLETAQWSQGKPYNDQCRISPAKNAVTGCVATAMAIFLRYMKYPAHGKGELAGYKTNSKGYEISGYSIDDHEYRWDDMPLKNTEVQKATAAQKAQIAQLMHDCGVMVEMDYDTEESGAYSMSVVPALAEHMGYSAAARYCMKSMYSPEEWVAMLVGEIDRDRPVLYSAQDKDSGGHAFIIDGYDGNGKFHVNWGWGGTDNGFYSLDLKVDDYRFSVDQDMIVGLEKDPDGKDVAVPSLEIIDTGLQLMSGSISQNVSFSVSVNSIANFGGGDFDGKLSLALVGEDGEVKEMLGRTVSFALPGTEGGSYYMNSCRFSNCRISVPVGFKDRVVLLSQTAGNEHETVRYDSENGAVGYLCANPYSFIRGKSVYSAGDLFGLDLILGGGEALDAVEWYFDGTRMYAGFVVLKSGTHTVKAVIRRGTSDVETIVRSVRVE